MWRPEVVTRRDYGSMATRARYPRGPSPLGRRRPQPTDPARGCLGGSAGGIDGPPAENLHRLEGAGVGKPVAKEDADVRHPHVEPAPSPMKPRHAPPDILPILVEQTPRPVEPA